MIRVTDSITASPGFFEIPREQRLTITSETRQAILTMWEDDDLRKVAYEAGYPDYPCTLSIQFLIRKGKLHCIVTMRSEDVWLGMPNDIAAFCFLQITIADFLGVDVGTYYHRVGSLHLYEKNEEKANEALKFHYPSIILPTMGNTIPHLEDFHLCIDVTRRVEESLRDKITEVPLQMAYGLPSIIRFAIFLASLQSKTIPENLFGLYSSVLGKEFLDAAHKS